MHRSGDHVVFDTTCDTSGDLSGTWSHALSRGLEGGRGSHEGFAGLRGWVGTFSTWL